MKSEPTPFRWLHFSDLHVGNGALPTLWQRFRTLLHDDLDSLLKRVGPIDVIVFSGDLTQKGTPDEFDRLDEVLESVLSKIGTFQERPRIIAVPGNHDLSRPGSLSPQAISLKQWWNDAALREGLWTDEGKQFRDFIATVFENFTAWQSRAIGSGLHLAPETTGYVPGDATYTIKKDAESLGIVTLNSAWLQLSGADYRGRLHVGAEQLGKVTHSIPDEWTRSRTSSLLVTHHPSSWLGKHAPSSWINDINPPGRFDLHLFGHMHEPEVLSSSHGGGFQQRDVQAASLFGLETFGDGSLLRIQGYSVGEIRAVGDARTFQSWPRRLLPMTSGKSKIVPDASQDLDEITGSFELPYAIERNSDGKIDSEPTQTLLEPIGRKSDFELANIRYATGDSSGHRNVRRVELEECEDNLRQQKVVSVNSDWGMGLEGFVATLAKGLGVDQDCVFAIDFANYSTRERFLDDIKERLGSTFQGACEAIAEAGPSLVVFKDLDLPTDCAREIGEVEELARTVSDFAPETYLVVASRRAFRGTLKEVSLKALDEADLGIYVRDSELGGEQYSGADVTSTLFRHTDGVPSRIDTALRDLEIVSLHDLMASNPDYNEDVGGLISNVPSALQAAVSELADSEDRADQRAYDLLLALSSLPQGEQLNRLTRFMGVHPFGPMHARVLLDRSLIDSNTVFDLSGALKSSNLKSLIVPRPVREYVRDSIDSAKSKSIDRKAITFYFGDDWSTGDISSSPTGKRVRDALCNSYEIQNAETLILRANRRAVSEQNSLELEGAIRLASSFIGLLMKGDHFRAAERFSSDMVRLLQELGGFEKELTVIRYEYARALRMMGKVAEAKAEFESLNHSFLSRAQKQSAELGLALCLDKENDTAGAAEAAKRALKINPHCSAGAQAELILANQISDPASRKLELSRLLHLAQKKKYKVLCNNILLDLARLAESADESPVQYLEEVIKSASNKEDFYNTAEQRFNWQQKPCAVRSLTRSTGIY
ncbi:metallophosphoesterase [Sphingomonas rhizophila]|uniref:Metallophosphoesterase n=1 Tax=Sphingomonas rhizophila TaxID=2071607 RepID=A0A7G9S8Q9_9SPHN|nr:metallophosphoesterase [Sphingomonas rhizophila]QNN64234.1 metallophosphoesterase [Sphingomonas rhizophila]